MDTDIDIDIDMEILPPAQVATLEHLDIPEDLLDRAYPWESEF